MSNLNLSEFDNWYSQQTDGGTSVANDASIARPTVMCDDSAKSLLSSPEDQDPLKQFNHMRMADGNGNSGHVESGNFTLELEIHTTSGSKPKESDMMNESPTDRVPSSKKPKNAGASKTRSKKSDMRMRSVIYADVMAALARQESSYSLLYELPSCLNSKIHPNNTVHSQCAASPHKTKPVKKPSPVKKYSLSVKFLTGTGMLDGVPVSYVSTSSKLPGIIKGTGYLCGCQSCKYIKTVTANEFEHHAGCKTSHPNDHIRFENGVSIFRIIQELKVHPENKWFDAIQNSIGFPIREEARALLEDSLRKANGGRIDASAPGNLMISTTQTEE